jgi:dienelactone hydrolase
LVEIHSSSPSLLEVPTEIKKLKELNIPILWNFCEFDQQIGPDKQKVVEEIFEGKNYFHNYYEGASHGFAVRVSSRDVDSYASKLKSLCFSGRSVERETEIRE